MSNQAEQVINWIVDQGQGHVIVPADIAAMLSFNLSVVNTAIATLREAGALTGQVYTGREWVHPQLLVAALKESGACRSNAYCITDDCLNQLSRRLWTNNAIVLQAISMAIETGYLKQDRAGQYGRLVRLTAAA